MLTDVKKVGELFKERRAELKISLKEVESVTSIRSGYLEAIEEGNVDNLLATIYMYGFMKQYAEYLGFDLEKLARELPEAFKVPQEKHDFAYGIGTLEMRGSVSGGVKWLPNFLRAVGVVGVLAIAWFMAKWLGLIV